MTARRGESESKVTVRRGESESKVRTRSAVKKILGQEPARQIDGNACWKRGIWI